MIYDKETEHKKIREAIAAWVLDPTLPEPLIQSRCGIVWEDCSWICALDPNLSCNFRLKPHKRKMIRVNGIEVPEPETVAPKVYGHYFVPSPDLTKLSQEYYWSGDSTGYRRLEQGLVYLTQEDAIERSKAMTKYEVIA